MNFDKCKEKMIIYWIVNIVNGKVGELGFKKEFLEVGL